jgi:phosphoribosylformylglycinamidine cyclo-ligase
VPPLFTVIQARGKVADDEMFRTFNMGLGLLLVVPQGDADSAMAHLERSGERAWIVGAVEPGPRGVEIGG